MATLKYVNEQGEDETLHFGPDHPEILVGRNKECDLKTRNNTVSRLHAKFCWVGGRYSVIDLDSANGTYVRKRRVKESELEDGESVFVGSLPVEFRLDDADRRYLGETVNEPTPMPPPSRPTQDLPAMPAAPATPPAEDDGVVESRRPTAGYDTSSAQGAPAQPIVMTAAYEGALEPGMAAPAQPEEDLVSFGDGGPAEAPAGGPDARKSPEAGTGAKRVLDEQRQRQAREETLEARIAALEAEVAERDDRIRMLGSQVEDLTRVLARHEEAAAGQGDMEARLVDLERALEAIRAEKQSLEEAVESARSLQDRTAQEAADCAARIREATAEAETVRAARDEVQARLAEADGRIAGLQLELADLRRDAGTAAEREALKASAAQADAARQAAEESAAQAVARAQKAENRASEAESQARQAEEARRAAAVEAESLRARVAETDAGREAQAEVETLRAKVADLVVAQSRLVSERDALQEENQRWDSLKQHFESERQAFQSELEALRGQVTGLTARLEEAKGAAGKAGDVEAQARSLANELAELKVEIGRAHV